MALGPKMYGASPTSPIEHLVWPQGPSFMSFHIIGELHAYYEIRLSKFCESFEN